MKCELYLIAILLCLGILILGFTIGFCIRHGRRIVLWWKRKRIWRFFINIVVPFLIPLVLSIVAEFRNHEKGINGYSVFLWVTMGLALINTIFQFIVWLREHKEEDLRWRNQAARHAYNNLFKIHKDKNTRMRTAYHYGLRQGMLSDADVPYNIFSQIRTICWEFSDTISLITGIEPKDLSASFVYHYTYQDANKHDKEWRWVTGKGSKFNTPLNSFTGQQTDSTFSYMANNCVSTLFYNDKESASKESKYSFSYRDNSHNRVGSFFAAKIAFSSNADTCCEAILMIGSYGKRFLDDSPRVTEKEMKNLILDDILPCYRHLLQTELAMLYFRHQSEGLKCQNTHQDTEKIIATHRYKSLVSTTKKIWYKNEEDIPQSDLSDELCAKSFVIEKESDLSEEDPCLSGNIAL